MAMNARTLTRSWWPGVQQARLERRQRGFAMYDSGRRPGLTAPVANAHARFEHEARSALREWLMLLRRAKSRGGRGMPNEGFGLPPGPRSRDASPRQAGSDDDAAGHMASGGQKRCAQRLYSFASFSVSRARIIASRPTAVKVVPHSM